MRDCFFLHNPKAGGTSLRTSLAREFAPERVCPTFEFTPEVYGRNPPGLPPGYGLYIGHYGRRLADPILRGHALISNFRHPAARITSLYSYFRHVVPETSATSADETYFAVRLAKSADLEAFVACDDPRVAIYTREHHARQLAFDGWSLRSAPAPRRAAGLVDDLDWLFVCEFPELSLRWGREVLDHPDLEVGRENLGAYVESERATVARIGVAAFNAILDHNQADLAVYEAAVRRLFLETGPRRRARPIANDNKPRAQLPYRGAAASCAALAAALALLPSAIHRSGADVLVAGARAAADPPAALADPHRPLSRRDLVQLARFAATQPAPAHAWKAAAGRAFRADVPFGCSPSAPAPKVEGAQARHVLARFGASSGRLWLTDPLEDGPACAHDVGVVAHGLPALALSDPAASRDADRTIALDPGSNPATAGSRLRLRIEGTLGRSAPLCSPSGECVLDAEINGISVADASSEAGPRATRSASGSAPAEGP